MSPAQVALTLRNQRNEIRMNDWRRLPELMNKDGAPCQDAYGSHVCSSSTILGVLYDIMEME